MALSLSRAPRLMWPQGAYLMGAFFPDGSAVCRTWASMSFRSLKLLLCLALTLLGCVSSPAARLKAGPVPTAPAPPVREARRALIDSIGATLRERYVDPDVAERMIESLHQHWERGDYDTHDDGAFTKRVSADLRAVSHDEHLALDFGAADAVAAPGTGGPGGSGSDGRFGFGPSQRLSGNVALLPIFGFVPAQDEAVQESIADSLTQVADAAALIIDLRDNNGGRAPTVALVISYLLDGPPILLDRVERRYDHSSYELWTHAEVKGTRFGGKKPLYVLTSVHTFSGGEGLAYDLQVLGRAKVIGETTRGGANPPQMFELGGGFRVLVPVARSINAVTHSSWEGVGVIPDVSVPADRALDEAHRHALKDLARSGESAG